MENSDVSSDSDVAAVWIILNSLGTSWLSIVFDSKTKPWGGFVQTISNYLSWLYAHSINAALLSLFVGREFGYSEKRLLELGIGAFLHDVGKIFVAKSILDKPGTLDEDEKKVMRQHTEFGAKLLNGFQLPQICLDIAAKHHERMDGSGYPLGLTAAQITEEVQIVMVADAIDAITAYRPYRPSSLLSEGIRARQRLQSLLSRSYLLLSLYPVSFRTHPQPV